LFGPPFANRAPGHNAHQPANHKLAEWLRRQIQGLKTDESNSEDANGRVNQIAQVINKEATEAARWDRRHCSGGSNRAW